MKIPIPPLLHDADAGDQEVEFPAGGLGDQVAERGPPPVRSRMPLAGVEARPHFCGSSVIDAELMQ